jgi:hypothetical protein
MIDQHRGASVSTAQYPGQIDTHSCYTLAELSKRLRLSKGALRTARRAGLKVRRIGTRSYILGEDVIEFLRAHAKVVSDR